MCVWGDNVLWYLIPSQHPSCCNQHWGFEGRCLPAWTNTVRGTDGAGYLRNTADVDAVCWGLVMRTDGDAAFAPADS